MHVGSPVWPRCGKQASIFTSLKRRPCQLLRGSHDITRWPRQDKQSAAGRKMAGPSGGRIAAVHVRRAVTLQEKSDKHFDTFRSRVRPRFCYSLVFGSGGADGAGRRWRRDKSKSMNCIRSSKLKIKRLDLWTPGLTN